MDGGATLKRARDACVRRGGRRGRGAAHLHERGELHGASLSNLEAGGDAGELGVAVERRGGGPAERKCAYAALRPFALRMSLPPLNSSRRPFTTGGATVASTSSSREGRTRAAVSNARVDGAVDHCGPARIGTPSG